MRTFHFSRAVLNKQTLCLEKCSRQAVKTRRTEYIYILREGRRNGFCCIAPHRVNNNINQVRSLCLCAAATTALGSGLVLMLVRHKKLKQTIRMYVRASIRPFLVWTFLLFSPIWFLLFLLCFCCFGLPFDVLLPHSSTTIYQKQQLYLFFTWLTSFIINYNIWNE